MRALFSSFERGLASRAWSRSLVLTAVVLASTACGSAGGGGGGFAWSGGLPGSPCNSAVQHQGCVYVGVDATIVACSADGLWAGGDQLRRWVITLFPEKVLLESELYPLLSEIAAFLFDWIFTNNNLMESQLI